MNFRGVMWLMVLVAICQSQNGFGQSIVINEVSQGDQGSNQEYVEFVVTGNSACSPSDVQCLDLRGWIFDDNNGYFSGGPTTGAGIADGACRFSTDGIWSCVPAGTKIVIYNDADANDGIVADDTDLNDGNATLIIPISSTLFERTLTTPNTSDASYSTNSGDWLSGGSWAHLIMSSNDDSFQVWDPADMSAPVHGVSWGPDNAVNNFIYFVDGASANVHYFTHAVSDDPYDQNNWTEGNADDQFGAVEETPGATNNAANLAWLGEMNPDYGTGSSFSLATSSINSACGGCSGTATVAPSGGVTPYSYAWSTSATTQAITNLCAGNVDVTVTDAGGCSAMGLETIVQVADVSVTLSTSVDPTCFGYTDGAVSVDGSGGQTPYSFLWNNGGTSSNNTGLPEGSHLVTVTDLTGCSDLLSVSLNAPLDISLTALATDASCGSSDGSISADAGGTTYSYAWSTGVAGSQLFSVVSGSYSVTATDANGCFKQVSVSVSEVGCDDADSTIAPLLPLLQVSDPYIPNVFSPNGDGINEIFIIVGSDVSFLQCEVYNRWGQKLASWEGVHNGWDGRTFSGEEAPEGTYYYKAEIVTGAGETIHHQGPLTLIR